MKAITKAVAGLAVLGLLAGCTSVSRGLGSVTANKYSDARSGTVWVVAPPQLEPPALSDKTVYISFRNISDSNVDLTEDLRQGARDLGWQISNDPQSAKYRLRASLRYFGEVEPESGGVSVARGLGNVAGAAVGAGVGFGIASAAGSGTAGAIAGASVGGIAGGLMAEGMSNASRPREWAMIIDFVLEEYSAKPITYSLSTGSSSGRVDSAGAANARMVSGGGERSGNRSSASTTKTSNYYPHGLRLSAWANQMNMKEEEALPEITQRTKKVVGQILPQ